MSTYQGNIVLICIISRNFTLLTWSSIKYIWLPLIANSSTRKLNI